MQVDIETVQMNSRGINLDYHVLPLLVENVYFGITGIIFEGQGTKADVYLFREHPSWGNCLKGANLEHWDALPREKAIKLQNDFQGADPKKFQLHFEKD